MYQGLPTVDQSENSNAALQEIGTRHGYSGARCSCRPSVYTRQQPLRWVDSQTRVQARDFFWAPVWRLPQSDEGGGEEFGAIHVRTYCLDPDNEWKRESWPDFFLPWSLEALTYQAGLVIQDSKREFPPQHSQREIPLRFHVSGVPKPQKVYS